VLRIEYFAYASNMHAGTMLELCPTHRFLGVARLDDHRLAFSRRSVRTGTGVADIVASEGACVWGALYLLEQSDLASLDRKEGQGWAYLRATVRVWLREDHSQHRAFAYAVLDKEPAEVMPSDEYLRGVLLAARERGLPEHYIDSIKPG
jgi:gamma-glutamylcyclotransferase